MALQTSPKLRKWLVDEGHCVPNGSDEYYSHAVGRLLADDKLTPQEYEKLTSDLDMNTKTSPDPNKVFAGNGSGGGDDHYNVEVKDQSHKFSTKRWTGKHTKTGQEIWNPFTKSPAEWPSEFDRVRTGVLFKYLAQRGGLNNITMQEWEKQLLTEMCHKEPWSGELDGEYVENIKGERVKQLLDDNTSGGLELSPISFDDSIVMTAVLTGELFPFVDVQRPTRGRRIEGGSLSHVSASWGQGDNTTAPLFNTASMASAIDSTVYGCSFAIEAGRDFLSDAGVNVGTLIQSSMATQFRAEMDKVIAQGDGSSQPQGLTNASGLSTVSSTSGTGGPQVLDDWTSLYFAINKAYRTGEFNPSFVTNDTSYKRSRQIAVDAANDPATDSRPVLSPLTEIASYMTLQRPHRIQNDIANKVAIFGALSKYRLWLRQGLSIEVETRGRTLQRDNLALIIGRCRAAGKVVDSSAFAKITDFES